MSRHPAPTIDDRFPDPGRRKDLVRSRSRSKTIVALGLKRHVEQRSHAELLLCHAQCDRSDDAEGERAEVSEIDTEVVAVKKPSIGSVSQTETDRVPASS